MDPETGQLRKLADLPHEFRACLDALELDAEDRVVKFKLRDSLRALENLVKHLNLLEPLPEPMPAPMHLQAKVAEMCLDRLSLEDLQALRRLMVKAGVGETPPGLPPCPSQAFGAPATPLFGGRV